MQYDQYAYTLNTPTMRCSKLPDNMCPTWSCPYTKLPDCVCVCVGVCAMPNSMSEVTSEHISQHARVDCLQPLLLEYMCACNVRSLWCSCISNVSSPKKKKRKGSRRIYTVSGWTKSSMKRELRSKISQKRRKKTGTALHKPHQAAAPTWENQDSAWPFHRTAPQSYIQNLQAFAQYNPSVLYASFMPSYW